jgi:hypothetical protein
VRAPSHDKILQFPYRGAPQTVGVIKQAALAAQSDYAVRQLAERITERLPSKDYLSEYLAIYYFVLAHTRYMRDPRTVELVRAPDVVARELLAGHTPALDCDDQSALICALVLAMGGECRVVTVAFGNTFYKGNRQYSHVFAQAREPYSKAWITLDPVAADRTQQMIRRTKAAKIWPVA